ncbi:MAG TPA: patatin-like phospholipase family protein [Acidimicrobiales bacterium]|nr:patatin-like phospholipase family protein [Acidimicrobiales bacterium]
MVDPRAGSTTTAWVLRGGAGFAAAQVGMARALMEAGCHPDMLYGTSAGALNAAWLAVDPTREGLAALASSWSMVRRGDIFPVRPVATVAGLLGLADCTFSSAPLARWLGAKLQPFLPRLEDAALPLCVIAADLETGEEVLLESGPSVPALLASCAMPGIFPPVRFGGRWLVDGSVVSDAPVGPAVMRGAGRVFVLPTVPTVAMARPRGALGVLLRSVSITLDHASAASIAAWASRCELYVLPAPTVPGSSAFSFDRSQDLVEAAYALTSAWIGKARPVANGARRTG